MTRALTKTQGTAVDGAPASILSAVFRYYDITVTLDEVRPLAWRRFLLAAEVTFADLHRAIQDACGWGKYHLFDFSSPAGERIAGLPDPDGDDEAVPDASKVALSSALVEQGVCRYVYDFGDHREHTVRTDGIVESGERFHRRLLGGARAFPPEDCGGVPGYERCVEVARGGEDDEGLREWFGDWEPERFDLDAARRAFDTAVATRARLAVPPARLPAAGLGRRGRDTNDPTTGARGGSRARRAGRPPACVHCLGRWGPQTHTDRQPDPGRRRGADRPAGHRGQPVPLAELSDRLWQLVDPRSCSTTSTPSSCAATASTSTTTCAASARPSRTWAPSRSPTCRPSRRSTGTPKSTAAGPRSLCWARPPCSR